MFFTNQELSEIKVFRQKNFLNTMFNSNLANWFFSDKRKLYTKQKGYHGVGERVGQDLELYTCISKKILSPQHRKRISDSWQCVPPRRPRGFGADSVDRLPSEVLVHLSLPRTQEREG